MAKALLMEHTTDPKDFIVSQVAPYLDRIKVMGARIVVGVYVRTDTSEKTQGGIIVPKGKNQAGDEDHYQGTVGLLLKAGPLAFKEDPEHQWGDIKPAPGDWVAFRPSYTTAFYLGNQRCRHLEDVHVDMILDRPDLVL